LIDMNTSVAANEHTAWDRPLLRRNYSRHNVQRIFGPACHGRGVINIDKSGKVVEAVDDDDETRRWKARTQEHLSSTVILPL